MAGPTTTPNTDPSPCPGLPVVGCVWGGMQWLVSLRSTKKLDLGTRLYTEAELAASVAALAAELEAMHDMRRELQQQIATLQDRCARAGVEARRAERERLQGYFRDALADTGITWPGEVDILYDKCFGAPYVPDEAA